jgi:hypothetical protein
MWSSPTWLWWQRNWALPIFLHLAHGRPPISLQPLLPMASRSTGSCARLQAEGCFGKTTTSGSHLPSWRSRCVEVVIPQGTAGPDATHLDTTLLVFTGSREHTEREYRELLHRASLTLLRITPTASPFSMLEATPAQDGQR